MADRNELTTSKPAESAQRPALPAVDIFEDASGITLLADMPGVSKERLEVKLDERLVRLGGSRSRRSCAPRRSAPPSCDPPAPKASAQAVPERPLRPNQPLT